MNMMIPKVELHVHLDGSVRLSTLAELTGLSLEEVQNQAVTSSSCQNLEEYLTRFSLPISVMQTKENLRRIARELGEDLMKDHVLYAEVRFFPLAHTKEGLEPEEVILSILEGFQEVEIPIHLILCMMRNESLEKNVEVIHLAKRFLNKGVVGLDLAGDEENYETSLFQDLFHFIHTLSIPFTIHAGEMASAESVISAIQFGTSRIGHGVRSSSSDKALELLKEKQILLEICPTSNIQTKAVKNIKEHPIWKFYQMGIPVCINTDNRTVSFTDLEKEYRLLSTHFPFTLEDFCRMNQMAVASSFASEEEKRSVNATLEQYLKQFKEWR